MTTMGSKIKTLRQQQNLTLEKLGQQVKVGKSYIWELENQRLSPTAEKLLRIAQALDVTVDYLVDPRQSELDDKVKQQAFFNKFDRLDEKDQRRVMDLVDVWSKRP